MKLLKSWQSKIRSKEKNDVVGKEQYVTCKVEKDTFKVIRDLLK